ncbi:MAG: metallophosphoesterase [Planctomycetaceae bacterium]
MSALATRIQGPVAVIGDVHGQVDQLLAVLDQLRLLPRFEQRWIVFIGDLVDRGPDPKSAMDVVCDLLHEHPRTTVVAGNHDYACAASIGVTPTPAYCDWGKRWLDHYDAETTFQSYGAEFGNFQELHDHMPAEHRELLGALPWCVEHPQYLFVHAGLDGKTPFDLQLRILRQRDTTLNRPQWLCSKEYVRGSIPNDCPVTVVSGHVQVPRVTFGPQRILLDTTGGLGGSLSCVLLPENKVISSGSNATPQEHAMADHQTENKSWWKFW